MIRLKLSDLLFGTATRRPEKTALTWGEGSGAATFAELAGAVEDQASVLVDSGLSGRRVGLMTHNRPEMIVIWMACLKAGVVPVFINPELARAEVEGVIDDLELEIVFSDADLANDTPRTVALGDAAGLRITEPGIPSSAPDINPDHRTGGVVLTSGSTGRPKYVAVPHEAYVLKGLFNAQRLGWRGDDAAYAVMPLFHVGGQCETVAPALAAGARIDLVENFSASRLWDDFARLGTTHLHATGSLLAMAMSHGEPESPPPLKRVVASFRPDLVERMRQSTDADLVTLYGLTECPLGTISEPGDDLDDGWVGRPYVGWAGTRITGEDGLPVADGESGEVQFRNASCTSGYLANAVEAPFTADGWLRTGDMGTREGEGLRLVGRIKEMIRRSGENIAPAQIEGAALEHPAVLEAAAVGHPDAIRDEEVRLFVVLDDETGVAPETLREFLEEGLARYKLPRYVDIVDSMPRTATGKVDKPKLIEGNRTPMWECE
jgi:acyl-CoA synthetase (AMP-forming)/AMP-acid ligase II